MLTLLYLVFVLPCQGKCEVLPSLSLSYKLPRKDRAFICLFSLRIIHKRSWQLGRYIFLNILLLLLLFHSCLLWQLKRIRDKTSHLLWSLMFFFNGLICSELVNREKWLEAERVSCMLLYIFYYCTTLPVWRVVLQAIWILVYHETAAVPIVKKEARERLH